MSLTEKFNESDSFGIAIFDKYQIVGGTKYQQYGNSSIVRLITPLCIVDDTVPPETDSISLPTNNLEMKYIDRPIIFPHGLTLFECTKALTAVLFSSEYQYLPTKPIGIIGHRFYAYCHFVSIVCIVKRIRRLIPQNDDTNFGFQHTKNTDSIFVLEISSKLDRNNGNGGSDGWLFYTYMSTLKCCITNI